MNQKLKTMLKCKEKNNQSLKYPQNKKIVMSKLSHLQQNKKKKRR